MKRTSKKSSVSPLRFAPSSSGFMGSQAQITARTGAKPNPTVAADTSELMRIIRPGMKDRFTSVALRGLTPDALQSILTGALQNRSLREQLDLFALMEETWPALDKCTGELKRALQSAETRIEPYALPGQQPTPEAQRRADLLQFSISAWRPKPEVPDESGWKMFLHDLADAWTRGISVQELIWQQVDDLHGMGPAILPRSGSWVSPRFYQWRDDPESGTTLRLFRTPLSAGPGEEFPYGKFIIATHRARTGLFAQTAMLRSLASLWIGSSFSQDWVLNLAQVFGLPFRWVTYDPSMPTGERTALLAMMEMMGSAGYGAFPQGTELNLHELTKPTGDSPQVWQINFADRAVQLLLLGQTLTTDVADSGSRALGEVHSSVRADVIRAVASWASEQLNNQFVPPLIRFNFGDESELPVITIDLAEVKDAAANATRMKTVTKDMGLPVGKKWLYDYLDIPQPTEGEDVFPSPADVEKEATAALALKNAGAPDPNAEQDAADKAAAARVTAGAEGSDATQALADHVVENLTGVQSRWLRGLRPTFEHLVRMAQADTISDADFIHALKTASANMPDLFKRIDTKALENALYDTMSTALVNGVSQTIQQTRPRLLAKRHGTEASS